jgi:GntR family transcriptional regulator
VIAIVCPFASGARECSSAAWTRLCGRAEAANVEIQVERKTTKTTAPANIAERLGISEDDPVTCTRYLIRMGNPPQPIASSLAWEPLAITGGTDVKLPHEGPHADKGIVDRFSTIGHEVNQVEERLDIRTPTAAEAKLLEIPVNRPVVQIT